MEPSSSSTAATKTPSRPPSPFDPPIFSALPTTSLLSPSAIPSRPPPPQPTPRRIPSTSSLRDESGRQSILKNRSSSTSLRSTLRGGSTSPQPAMSRRASSTLGTGSMSPTAASISANGLTMSRKTSLAADQPVLTAASIANDHFQKEVDHHQSADLQSETLVVIHDACYGHRFSRPRTPRAVLNSIVERPERIQAVVVGISAAFVRLAGRYTGGSRLFAPHPDLDLQQLPIPPFQIRKTARTLPLNSKAVTNVHGTKWMEDLKTMCDAAESRLATNGKELVRPRSTGKDSTSGTSAQAFHEGDLYLCSESMNAFEGALGGVCEAVDAVFEPGSTRRAFVAIRPPGHHCSANQPSGFCWVNNIHVGISYAAMTHGLTHAAILDFDLHHGDGSQEIAWEHNRKNAAAHRIGYFSLHDIKSYPCEEGDAEKVRNASVCIDSAHGQSVWNVHLEPWNNEQDFWDLYSTKYTILIDKARAFLKLHTDRLANVPNGPAPKAAIFISAGFDASEWEGAGMQRHKANVLTEFYARFTADVVRMAEGEGLGVNGRCISVLEGGYSNRALISSMLSHLAGFSDTRSAQLPGDEHINRLATEMTDRFGLADNASTEGLAYQASYEQEWWSLPLLEELEALVYPAAPPSKPREKSAPSYFAPTQSFTAKVVLPSRDRKSTGSNTSLELEAPPVPPVSWAVAAHELSKVLIPSDSRQTGSCRPEELNDKASRLRRERAGNAENRDSAGTPTKPVAGEGKMQLRVRKAKVAPSTPRPETPARRTVKDSRRTSVTSDPSKSPGPRTSRRKSANSTTAGTPSATEQDLPPPRPLSQGSVTVRKTAASKATASRSTTPKRAASAKKAPPVPRVPSTFLSAKTPEQSIASQPTTGTSEGAHDDIDQLASDVKKLTIKLKVPSPEENAAREKKAAEERKRRAPKGASTAARKQTSNVVSPQLSVSTSQDDTPLSEVPRQTSTLFTEMESATERQTRFFLATPEASSPTASFATPVIETTEPMPLDEEHRPLQKPFLGRTMSSQSSNAYAGISPPLTPGPASNVTSPPSTLFSPPASVSVTKHGLPGFTSSGPIPFAPSEASSLTTETKTEPN